MFESEEMDESFECIGTKTVEEEAGVVIGYSSCLKDGLFTVWSMPCWVYSKWMCLVYYSIK